MTLEERVDALFADYDTTRSPGCSVGIVQAGELAFARGYGMANLEHAIPLSSKSVFRIGSTSKQFTAAVILLLAHEGKLGLDDDIRTFLPELPDFGTAVTIRHLIHHTSGYRDYLTLMSLAGEGDADYYTDEDVLRLLARQRQLNFQPGEERLYSNSGYWLLSQVVLRVAERSLREYAAERIFAVLGMRSTHFHDDHTEIVPQRASGYVPSEGAGYEISMTTLPMIGDGGVFTSVEDLARWDRNFYEPRVGGEAFLEQMLTRGILNDGETLDYAFGLSHSPYRGLATVSHGGSFVGFRAQMLRFPSERTTIICLCNRGDANPTRLAAQIADIVLENRLAPLSDMEKASESAGEAKSKESKAMALTAPQLAAVAGVYYSEELDVRYYIRVRDGALELSIGEAGKALTLEPESPDRFRFRGVLLRLQRDTAGGFTGFQLNDGRVKNLPFARM